MAVTATADHRVVDRRRIELVEPGLPAMPIHHRDGRRLGDAAMADLVARVRASALRVGGAALDALAAALPAPIGSLSVRDWPDDFPTDLAVLRRAPWEARADSVMYRRVLAELARERGWAVHRYDARDVEAEAALVLGPRVGEVLNGPRAQLGPPWTRDHRLALAATVTGP